MMVIALAKSRRAREASHQTAYMGSCLTISHTCLPCLPSGRTLFCSDLLVAGKVVRWERWDGSELGSPERWEGSELGRWERWEDSRVARLERLEDSEVASWERWEDNKVARWGKCGVVGRWHGEKGKKIVKWQGGRFLVLLRVIVRFHLFFSDVDQQRNEGGGWVQHYFAWIN